MDEDQKKEKIHKMKPLRKKRRREPLIKLTRGSPSKKQVAAHKAMFLEKFSSVGNVAAAIRLVNEERSRAAAIAGVPPMGMDRKSHKRWLDGDAIYKQAFVEAQEHANDMLESEARRRAVLGVTRPVIRKGEQVMVPDPQNPGRMIPLLEREYSDTLLIFLMKGAMPGKYRERFEHEVAGPQGGPITIRVVESKAALKTSTA